MLKIEIFFDRDSSHYDVINQFVEKLRLKRFASKQEIINHLVDTDLILEYKNKNKLQIKT